MVRQQAKETLKNAGYYTDNLWSIHDVREIFNCTTEEAHNVLNKVFHNSVLKETIWHLIKMAGEDLNLVIKHEN